MSNIEKVSITLTSEIATTVREAVASGEYASSSEVVREALREWKLKRTLRQSDINELRNLWSEGLASGRGTLQSIEAIKHEGRRRLGKDAKKK
jgi:antitoxin ParD1/3/4